MPRIIGITAYNLIEGNYATYATGSEAASALIVSASQSHRYLAVPASASISYSIDKAYRREDQWAMYSFNADNYLASLRDYNDRLAETAVTRKLSSTGRTSLRLGAPMSFPSLRSVPGFNWYAGRSILVFRRLSPLTTARMCGRPIPTAMSMSDSPSLLGISSEA